MFYSQSYTYLLREPERRAAYSQYLNGPHYVLSQASRTLVRDLLHSLGQLSLWLSCKFLIVSPESVLHRELSGPSSCIHFVGYPHVHKPLRSSCARSFPPHKIQGAISHCLMIAWSPPVHFGVYDRVEGHLRQDTLQKVVEFRRTEPEVNQMERERCSRLGPRT